MGESVVFLGDLTFPAAGVQRWKELSLEGDLVSGLTGLPRGFEGSGSVADAIADWTGEYVKLAIEGEVLRLRALVSDDDSLYLDERDALEVAFRLAANVGGRGTLDVLGWGDAPDFPAHRVTVNDDGTSSSKKTSKAFEGSIRASAGYAELSKMVDAGLAAAAKARPPKLPLSADGVRAFAELTAALSAASPEAMRAALPKLHHDVSFWRGWRGKEVDLNSLFDSPQAVAASLSDGGPVDPSYQRHWMVLGIRLLAEIDLPKAIELARTLAKETTMEDLVKQSLGVLAADASDAGVIAALTSLRSLRAAFPDAVARDPVVKGVLRNENRDLVRRVRERLHEITREPPFGPLEYGAILEARALCSVLEARGTPDDRAFVIRLLVDHPERSMRDTNYVRTLGPDGVKELAKHAFTRPEIQSAAVASLFEVDPAAVPRVMETRLLEDPSDAQALLEGVAVALVELTKDRSKKTPEWDAVLALLAERLPKGEAFKHLHASVARLRGEGPTPEAEGAGKAPLVHVIEPAPSGRAACRGCKEKIPKGELRFGEAVVNVFDQGGEPTRRWYHLACAAEKRAKIFGPTLTEHGGEVPNRETLLATVATQLVKPARAKGRAKKE